MALPVQVSADVANMRLPAPFLMNPCVPATVVPMVAVWFATVIVGVVLATVVCSVKALPAGLELIVQLKFGLVSANFR